MMPVVGERSRPISGAALQVRKFVRNSLVPGPRRTRVSLRAGYAMVALALLPTTAMAAAVENLFFSELPIVASVSRLPQHLADASASVTVIDRDMIKASGARDVNDLFRLVPGFQTYPNNTDAARVTYHGLTDEDFSPRVQVLIDGRSQYSPLFLNGTNWATLPVALEDIERIEVVRGTNAVSFGSNAFLGVINIITVDPALAHGVSVGVNHGNQGVRDTTLRAGGRLGEAGDFRLTYQARNDDGFEDQFDWKDSFESRLFSARADLWLNNRDQLQFDFGHVDAVTLRGRLAKDDFDQLTGGEDPENPFRDFTQSSSHVQLTWRRALDAGSDVQLRYAYTEDRGSEAHIEREDADLFYVDAVGDLGTRHELESQHTFAPTTDTRLVWGGSYRLDSMRSDTYLYGQDEVYRRVGRIFGNLEWEPAGWFTGNLGMAQEYDSLAGRNFSPRLSANFHLSPEHTVRIGASRAYRTGSTIEYVGERRKSPISVNGGAQPYEIEYVGDPDMEQEEINTVEIGYLGEWKALRSSLDLRLFRERIPNRVRGSISRDLTDPSICNDPLLQGRCRADFSTAIQRVKIEGAEFQWRWQPFDRTRLMLGQAWVRIKSSYLPEVIAPGTNVTTFINRPDRQQSIDDHTTQSAPRSSTSLLLIQKLPYNLDFSLAGYWVGDMKWTRNTAVGFYRRFDARLGHTFNIGGQRGELAYTVQSLDGEHGEFKSNGDPADRIVDTRHWVSLRLDF